MTEEQMYANDEAIFRSKLLEWGVNTAPCKPIVLDCGKGDHVIVKKLIPRLKEKYEKLLIASCFPDVFIGDEVEQISIAQAIQRFGPLDRFNIYRWCIDHNHQTELIHAFEQMYDLSP